jgi:hypothetical protein
MSESGGDLNKEIEKLELTITDLKNRILALEKELKYVNINGNGNMNENKRICNVCGMDDKYIICFRCGEVKCNC